MSGGEIRRMLLRIIRDPLSGLVPEADSAREFPGAGPELEITPKFRGDYHISLPPVSLRRDGNSLISSTDVSPVFVGQSLDDFPLELRPAIGGVLERRVICTPIRG